MPRCASLVFLVLPMLATSVQSAPARIALVIGNVYVSNRCSIVLPISVVGGGHLGNLG